MGPTEGRLEIVFFDVETTIPTRPRQGFAILEFGAILVCPRKLVELQHYSTLVRPADLSRISSMSERCNGISRDKVIGAPTFSEIAETVYGLLHGRIWAGHNIVKFDCVRIREAFAEIKKPAPEPKGTIDSLILLTQKFGRRAGDMKMATLATYFGLGQQTHRSLDDVRMNLEVLKYCSTVLFLESSLPDVLTVNSWVSPNATTRSRSNGKLSSEISTSSLKPERNSMSFATQSTAESHHPIFSFITHGTEESKTEERDPLSMEALSNVITAESLQADVSGEVTPNTLSPDSSASAHVSDARSSSEGYLEVGGVCIDSVSASFVLSDYGNQKIALSHKGTPLGLCFSCLKVRFGLSRKFVNQAGLPRLSFVVDATPSLCNILDACDHIARKLYEESGYRSNWRHLLNRTKGFEKYPTARIHIPTAVFRDNTTCSTEMYRRESSGNLERHVFDKFDPAELDDFLVQGTLIDTFFWIDFYDYQQSAGMRLVADKLIIPRA